MMMRKCIESRTLRMRMSSISRIRGELSSNDRFKAGHRDLISSRGRNQLLVMKCRQLRINWLIWIWDWTALTTICYWMMTHLHLKYKISSKDLKRQSENLIKCHKSRECKIMMTNRTLMISRSRMMTMVQKSRCKMLEDEMEEMMICARVNSIQRLQRILMMD